MSSQPQIQAEACGCLLECLDEPSANASREDDRWWVWVRVTVPLDCLCCGLDFASWWETRVSCQRQLKGSKEILLLRFNCDLLALKAEIRVDHKFQLSTSEGVAQSWLRALAQVVTARVLSSGSCGFAPWRNEMVFFQAAGCGEYTFLQRWNYEHGKYLIPGAAIKKWGTTVCPLLLHPQPCLLSWKLGQKSPSLTAD